VAAAPVSGVDPPAVSLGRPAGIGYPEPMALRHVARLASWLAACAALVVLFGATVGRAASASGIVVAIAATVWLLLWLPRTAHAAFETGRYRRAARCYRMIAAAAFTAARERAAVLSRAGCDVAAGRLAPAERLLDRFDAAALDVAERVTWFNNRACIVLASGGDPRVALDLVERAVALRPDVPAVQHTRATALIAVGRHDDAIGVLDAMRSGGELSPALEVMRCRDLARAWDHKGQPDYAADYRDRARLVAR